MYRFVFLFFMFVRAQVSWAGKCDQFINDFKDMKTAQISIQDSLISNHDLFIDSFDSFADALKETSGKSYKKVVENMYKSSESIRKRKTKAQDISQKMSKKMDEMLKTAEECAKK